MDRALKTTKGIIMIKTKKQENECNYSTVTFPSEGNVTSKGYALHIKGQDGLPIPIPLRYSLAVWKCLKSGNTLICPGCSKELDDAQIRVYYLLPITSRSMACRECGVYLSPEGRNFSLGSYLDSLHTLRCGEACRADCPAKGDNSDMNKEVSSKSEMATQTEDSLSAEFSSLFLGRAPRATRRCKEFVDEYYEFADDKDAKKLVNRVDAQSMYDQYLDWCSRKGFTSLSKNSFYGTMDALIGPRIRSDSYKYQGIYKKQSQ